MRAPRLIPPAVRGAWDAFFHKDVHVHLGGAGPHLDFSAPPPREPTSITRDSAAQRQAAAELTLMRDELGVLLNAQAGTRQVLRHLALFERALLRHGLRALQDVPAPLLHGALEQFEGLVSNWSPVGLAMLRSKMAVALIEREREGEAGARARAPAPPDLGAATLPLQLDRQPSIPGVDVRCDEDVAAVYRAMGLETAPQA